jgi:cytochrome P450
MSTLFWLLAYIHLNSQQPDFLHEIETYTTASSPPKLADTDFHKLLSSSSLLNSALKETLRIQGHSIYPRNMEADTVIKVNGREYLLKKGSLAFAPSTLLNWNPDIYPEPQEWKADRFIEKEAREEGYLGVEHGPKLDTKKLKFPLLIWGGGSHMVFSLNM